MVQLNTSQILVAHAQVYEVPERAFTEEQILMAPDPEYLHALESVASPDRALLLSLVDHGFVTMAVNFYLTSLKPHNIQNYLILTLEADICAALEMYDINCFQYRNSTAASVSQYGSRAFKAKMNIRTDMILEALLANFTVLHTDIDVLFFTNPFKVIQCHYKDL